MGGNIDTRNGIPVVHLHGDHETMGRQHAALALSVCGDVVPRYLDRLLARLIAHAVPPLAAPASYVLKRLFHIRNHARIDPELRALLRGLAQGYGTDPGMTERLLFVADIVHYLAGRSFVPLAVPPMCSGFYAAGTATADGRQLIARNFDFFGRGVWNACNAIVVTCPDQGQRCCWIGALGAPAAPQGINESGLAFSLHTNFTRDVQTRGVPLFALCHRVMAHCSTLDEAIACITAEPRLCGLSMFLVDTQARRAAVVGFSANTHEVVYPEHDVLVRTNHYATAAMQAHEVAPYPWQRNSRGRYQRVHEMLAAKHGTLRAENAPAILSDCYDPWEGRQRVTGNIVACANTTQSMVLSPDEDALWLASGDHPVSHAAQYTGFRLSALFAGDSEHYALSPLPGASPLDAHERAALHEYEEAWSAYFDQLDSDTAVFRLRAAGRLLPEECIFPRLAGILLMKQGRYTQALPLMEQNAAYDYRDALMQAEAWVWVGRCHDLLGRREEAKAAYEAARALNVAPLAAAAARHLSKPFRKRELFDVSPEFIVGTALARYRP